MRRRKTLLLLTLLVATVFSGAWATDATFSARTRNSNNFLSDGTLVLVNTVSGGTACFSTAGGTTDTNVNNSCDQLFNLTATKPGDSATRRLRLMNDGSIDGSLKMYQSTCATTDGATETYHGTGNLCNTIQVYVQEYDDNTYTTKTNCLFGGGSATVCDFSDTSKTLTALGTTYNSTSPYVLGSLTAGSSRYVEVGFALANTADNTMQGRQATFDLTWVL